MGKPSSCNKNNNNNNVLAWKLVISNSHLRVEYVYIKYNQQRTQYKSEYRHYHLIKYLHIIFKKNISIRSIYYKKIATKLKIYINVPTLVIIPYIVKTKFSFKETSFLSLPMVVMVPIYAHLHN